MKREISKRSTHEISNAICEDFRTESE